jgi:formylglycine-generating enzyme
MPVKHFVTVAAFASVTALSAPSALGQITISTVPIGNPGNAPDPATGRGSVAYTYNIGSTEVTNAQFASFLNAVAATDTHGLYTQDGFFSPATIIRSGSSGSFTYQPAAGIENHPVGWVPFYNATRFANWLHNGQPTGPQDASTTEDGAYTLTPDGMMSNSITRNASWQWAIASENEWYKAAFHQPAALGGDIDDYWLYPTSGNTVSTAQANYDSAIGTTTPVGSYAANFYGTFDMGGNVWEWTDTIDPVWGRGIPGRAFGFGANFMSATGLIADDPGTYASVYGFRVTQVPAPASALLVAIGGAMAARRRR